MVAAAEEHDSRGCFVASPRSRPRHIYPARKTFTSKSLPFSNMVAHMINWPSVRTFTSP